MANENIRPMLCLLLFSAGVWSFQWTSVIQNNSVKYVCSGHDLLLPWNFTAPADNVYTIQWFFRGLSEELIATLTHGHFSPSVPFSGRVEFLPGAGIVVKGVVPGDRGNYSVEVISHAGTERQNVLVEITEAPSSVSGGLSVQQDRAAVRDGVTGDWAIQLTCGRLTSRGQPPIAVGWITPEGHKEASTTYQDGNFHLVLPNPVRGGNYSCQLDTPSPAASCLAGGSGLLQQASVAVDEVGARLTLIEARQVDLLAENQRLEELNHQLTEKDANLTTHITAMQAQDAILTAQITALEGKDSNITSYVHYLENNLTSYVHLLENKDANLTDQIHSLQDQLSEIETILDRCNGMNYALLNDSWRDASVPMVGSNYHCDQSTLPEGWYRFQLHGVNAIIPTTCVPKYHCGTQVSTWLDLQGHALPGVGQELQVQSCGSWDVGCCSGYTPANQPATVRNCGTFYIYKLKPPGGCNAVYCTTAM